MADEINLELKLDSSGAKKSLKDFESTAGGAIDSISGAFSALKGLAAAAVAALAVREVVDFFKDAANASARGEEEIAKMTASLKSLGEYTPQVVEDFQDFAQTLQANSKFSDDAVLAQVAYAKQLGLSNDETKKLIQAAADLASIKPGGSLEASVADLGKSLSGTAKGLKTTIPEIGSFTEAQLKAGAAIDFVSNRLKGVAKEAAATYSGSLLQLGNAHEDLMKAVGSLITQNPAFLSMIKLMTYGLSQLEEFVKDNKTEIMKFAAVLVEGFLTVVQVTIEHLARLAVGLRNTINIIAPLIEITIDLIEAFLGFRIVQDVINSVGQVFQDSVEIIMTSIKGLLLIMEQIPGGSAFMEKLGVNIQETVKDIDNATSALDEMRNTGFDFDKSIEHLDSLKNGVKKFADTSTTAINGTVDVLGKVGNVVNDAAGKIAQANKGISQSSVKAADEQEAASQKVIKAQVEAAKAAAKANEQREKLTTEAKKFLESYFQKERNTVDGVIAERDRDLAQLDKFMSANIPAVVEKGEHLRQVIIAESEQKIQDIRQKALDDFKKKISEAAASPVKAFVSEIDFDPKAFAGMEKAIGGAIGTLSSILKGGSGATDLIKGAAGAFADAFLPGVGAAVSEIVGVLAQGPEQVKKMIDEFIAALPAVVENIARSIPVLLTGLARIAPQVISGILDALPDVIRELVDQLPAIIQAFTDAIPAIVDKFSQAMPLIIDALIDAFIVKNGAVKIGVAIVAAMFNPQTFISMGKAIFEGFATPFKLLKLPDFKFPDLPKFTWPHFDWPAFPKFDWPKLDIKLPDLNIPRPKWLDDIGDALNPLSGKKSGLGGIVGAVGGFIGGAIGGVASVFGGGGGGFFASGGTVPDGFPNDSFPARLTSREHVLDVGLSERLDSFLNKGGSGTSEALLMKIVALLQEPMSVNTVAEVDQRAFANIILQLSRQNARLS